MKRLLCIILVLSTILSCTVYANDYDEVENQLDKSIIRSSIEKNKKLKSMDLKVTEINHSEFVDIIGGNEVKYDKYEKVDMSKLAADEKMDLLTNFGLNSIVSKEDIEFVSEVIFTNDFELSDKNSLSEFGLESKYVSRPDYSFSFIPIQKVRKEEFTGANVATKLLDKSFSVVIGFISAWVWVPATVLGIEPSDFIPTANSKLTYLENNVLTIKTCSILNEQHNLWLAYSLAEKEACVITVSTALVHKETYLPYNKTEEEITPVSYTDNYLDNDFLKRVAYNRYYSGGICYEERFN